MAELPEAGFSDQFRITNGKKFSLKKCSTDPDVEPDKKTAQKKLQEYVAGIADLQNVLYADNRWSLLLIFQAMDAAGKDSTIKNLLSGVNPQGCEVYSFKRPRKRNWGMIFCGAPANACPSVAISAFSIDPIMRKHWWYASIPPFLMASICPKRA